MNATRRSLARAGLVVSSLMVVALTGCRTQVIENTRTVYVPAPVEPAPQPAPEVVYVPPPEQPPVVVIQTVNDFYEPLAVYGHWEVVGSYGRCWIPARVDPGWRPYSNGHWQLTDAGWYWVSDEPWGWATYHYGRWDFNPRLGWVWVPRTEWAPAWVSWREGGGYVGWAPLPPAATVGVSVDVYEPALVPRAYVFVEDRRMIEPVRPATVIVNNTTVINKTVNITKVKVVNKTVINEGPRPERIERDNGRKVESVSVNEFRRREEQAVAARERNIPTRDRKVDRTGGSRERQNTTVNPAADRPEARPVEAPTPRTQPVVAPSQSPVRDAEQDARKNRPNVTSAPAKVERESRPEKAVLPRQEVRPAEKPAVVAKPTPQPVASSPVREEERRVTGSEKKSPPTPVVFEPKSKIETRPTVEREAKSPVRVEAVAPVHGNGQVAPPSAKPADKQLHSPKEQERAAKQVPVKKEDGSKKKGKAEDKQSTNVWTRPSQQ